MGPLPNDNQGKETLEMNNRCILQKYQWNKINKKLYPKIWLKLSEIFLPLLSNMYWCFYLLTYFHKFLIQYKNNNIFFFLFISFTGFIKFSLLFFILNIFVTYIR